MRRRGRACALQILYQLDLARELLADAFVEPAVRAAMARFWHNFESVGLEDERFAERIVLGVARDVKALDAALGEVSQNWRIDRMDKVDRNILRLAAYELLYCPDIPRVASINEAVELTKRFSGQESAGFINGVLDKLVPHKADPPPQAAASPAATEPEAEARAETAAEAAPEAGAATQPSPANAAAEGDA